MLSIITHIGAEEILDSRGNPTIRAWVHTERTVSSASVPSGASTGKFEALELRDGDERFGGKGVQNAVKNINNTIAPALKGMDVTNQGAIDAKLLGLDGTEQKSKFGGNTLIGISIACAKAGAAVQGKDVFQHLQQLRSIKPSRVMPFVYANLLNGGKHAPSGKGFQEYHLIPITQDIQVAIEVIFTAQKLLKQTLIKRYGALAAGIGDEGGYALDAKKVTDPLDILTEVVKEGAFSIPVKFALDTAAQSFYQGGVYEPDETYGTAALTELYKHISTSYPIVSIEDPFHEEDFDAFAKLQASIYPIVVGDDLTVTNKKRLQKAINAQSIRGIIIKPNQIGTLSETLDTMELAREHNIECIVSHRSGETEDDFIADLAYAFGAFGIKVGGLQRGERIAKYNRLLQLQHHFSPKQLIG